MHTEVCSYSCNVK